MEKDLCKFNENVEVINKDLSMYKDEKGNMFVLNTINILARVDYMELSKEEYTSLKFQNKVEDLEYNIINIKKPVPKSEITKKEEDKYTIVDKEVAVRQIWNVSNPYGAIKSFTNKEDAIKLAEEINSKILEYYK
jgi:hypothetical protein